MPFQGYREGSRTDWGREIEKGSGLTMEQINCGALLRIADAVEKMSGSYATLIEERDYYKKRTFELGEKILKLQRSIRSLRGSITRMKKRR